jgi:hypothetical protein
VWLLCHTCFSRNATCYLLFCVKRSLQFVCKIRQQTCNWNCTRHLLTSDLQAKLCVCVFVCVCECVCGGYELTISCIVRVVR